MVTFPTAQATLGHVVSALGGGQTAWDMGFQCPDAVCVRTAGWLAGDARRKKETGFSGQSETFSY